MFTLYVFLLVSRGKQLVSSISLQVRLKYELLMWPDIYPDMYLIASTREVNLRGRLRRVSSTYVLPPYLWICEYLSISFNLISQTPMLHHNLCAHDRTRLQPESWLGWCLLFDNSIYLPGAKASYNSIPPDSSPELSAKAFIRIVLLVVLVGRPELVSPSPGVDSTTRLRILNCKFSLALYVNYLKAAR